MTVVDGYAYCADTYGELIVVDVGTPSSPVIRGNYDGDYALDIAVVGSLAFMSLDYGRGLDIIDVADPEAPVLGEHVVTGRPVYGLCADGPRVYVYEHDSWISILDAGDPANLVPLGSIDTGDEVWGLAAKDDLLLVSNDERALRVYDCTDPAVPVVKFEYGDGSYDGAIRIVGDMAYLIGDDGLLIADLSDPDAVVVHGPYEFGYFDNYRGFCMDDSHIYAVTDFEGVTVIDVTDPENPSEGITISLGVALEGVAYASGYLYVSTGHYIPPDPEDEPRPSEIYVFRINSPEDLELVATYEIPFGSGSLSQAATPLLVQGDYLYVAGYHEGVLVYDISDPAAPVEFGYYDTGDNCRGFALINQVLAVADGWDGAYFLKNDFIVGIEKPEEDGQTPPPVHIFSLEVFPNPFNPQAEISFELRLPGETQVTVHDLAGRLLTRLHQGPLAAGAHRLEWDGRMDDGHRLPSGTYLVEVKTETERKALKVTLTR